ncbi:MAG TPA: hypothetical protein VF450_02875 [Noviherbaspirillum sp.]
MIDQSEVEELGNIIESKLQEVEQKKVGERRRHWPRRLALSISVLVAAIVTHKIIEWGGFEHCLQSAELGLAALFDSNFSKVKE